VNLRLFGREELLELFTDAYAKAARADVDMLVAAEAFEAVRQAVRGSPYPLSVWNALDHEIGRATTAALEALLVDVRARVLRQLTARLAQHFDQIFHKDPDAGWQQWLDLYARSLGEWRVNFCEDLVALPAAFPRDIAQIRDWTTLALHERWTEMVEWAVQLADAPISRPARASMHVLTGKIHLFLFGRPTAAERHFRLAGELHAADPDVAGAWGQLWRQRGDTQRARDWYLKQIEAHPNYYEGYVNLATLHAETGDRALAETYFRQAIAQGPGSPYGYTALVEFLGRPEAFGSRSDEIEALETKLRALSPWYPSNDLIRRATVLQRNSDFDAAEQLFEEALRLEPDRLHSLLALGNCVLSRARAEAEAGDAGGSEGPAEPASYLMYAMPYFRRAAEVAPRAADGPLAIVALLEEAGDLDGAVEHCRGALQLSPGFEPLVRARLADLLTQLGRLDEAQQELTRAHELEPRHDRIGDVAYTIGRELLDVGNSEGAVALFDLARDSDVPASEARYHNEVGHTHYHHTRYDVAASHYRQAVQLAEQDVIMLSNLSLALERIDEPGHARIDHLTEAVWALDRALQIEQRPEYAARRDRLAARLRFATRYGEAALQLRTPATPIRFELRQDFMGALLNEAADALAPAALERVEALRERVLQETGVMVPGVIFSWLGDDVPAGAIWRLMLYGRTRATGVVASGLSDASDAVLETLRHVLASHLHELVTHDAAARLLAECTAPACSEAARHSASLNRALRLLRQSVRESGRLPDVAATAAAALQEGADASQDHTVELSAEPPARVVVHCAADDVARTELLLADVQKLVFEQTGVVIAPVEALAGGEAGAWQVEIAGDALTLYGRRTPTADQLIAEITERIAVFVDVGLVDSWLHELTATAPVLAQTARDLIGVPALCTQLRDSLRAGVSIRPLVGVLDDVLTEHATVPAAVLGSREHHNVAGLLVPEPFDGGDEHLSGFGEAQPLREPRRHVEDNG
jgi:tetratricopeptide (TPR) repeat protein